jgi:hypothetical protein
MHGSDLRHRNERFSKEVDELGRYPGQLTVPSVSRDEESIDSSSGNIGEKVSKNLSILVMSITSPKVNVSDMADSVRFHEILLQKTS